MSTNKKLKFLLLQVRNSDDAMRFEEIRCFARAIDCDASQIQPFDLLGGTPSAAELDAADMVLLGGSGHYSAAGEGDWLERALDTMRLIHARKQPTFASCWGFQAMARALGGRVIHDLPNAEIGTLDLFLTEEGAEDPIFGPLGKNFRGQAGHEDHVVALPEDAVLLASSHKVKNQAYRLADLPIYCTQFHPELDLQHLVSRLRAYPEYVERIAGVSFEEFELRCGETEQTELILQRMVKHYF